LTVVSAFRGVTQKAQTLPTDLRGFAPIPSPGRRPVQRAGQVRDLVLHAAREPAPSLTTSETPQAFAPSTLPSQWLACLL
jgi:hypothetical protein